MEGRLPAQEGEEQRRTQREQQQAKGQCTTLGFAKVHKNRNDKAPSCNIYYELHGDPNATRKVIFVTGLQLPPRSLALLGRPQPLMRVRALRVIVVGFCTTFAIYDHQIVRTSTTTTIPAWFHAVVVVCAVPDDRL
jgi:hypothetical protein